jgi:hypothetical protein
MPKLGICYPEYRKHRRSGQAIVTINGHDFLLGPHGTQVSRNAYDQRIAEWISSKFKAVRHVLINERLSRSFVNAATRRI